MNGHFRLASACKERIEAIVAEHSLQQWRYFIAGVYALSPSPQGEQRVLHGILGFVLIM